MLPVVRDGAAFIRVIDYGPEFGEKFGVLHVFRHKTGRRRSRGWIACFIETGWLHEFELAESPTVVHERIMDEYDNGTLTLSRNV